MATRSSSSSMTCAFWVVDLGPVAGEDGGRVIARGIPCEIADAKDSLTAP
ncbi:hypothetical protein Nwi_3097 [Nitrobacter winogradskyi Nb-255]|uniref:Uncharacterized protein n=1 Tax=Nitrobacter winogradskyi (strain ATCC 25391 / DSM 10237 / CIP 104748 / NCIMB 11846 / Nb-255) TaxID=323098 RepID=Q3SMZ7_NITWN|nr:hypothetical protein Nwi_3097 [Nitrobacter winogradskyi Nb-255]